MKLNLNAYQAKNGAVYLSIDGDNGHTALSMQQIMDLGIDVYALDDFDLQLFQKAYTTDIPQDETDSFQHLKCAIGAMIEKDAIRFSARSWCFQMVDVLVTASIFTTQEQVISIAEDKWNDGPANAVASELAKAVLDGTLTLIPCTEHT